MLIFDQKLIRGTFIQRLSRFSALVNAERKETYVYLPNSGRMKELLLPEAKVILSLRKKLHRKTLYDLIMVYYDSLLVSIDSRLPNKLVYEALRKGDIEELKGYKEIRGETTYGNSRLDFLLLSSYKKALIEVKSVTLVKERIAYFPDAITTRGVRHIDDLIKGRKEGYNSTLIFVVQRPDAQAFSPNATTDPNFAFSLKKAKAEGVNILAYLCRVNLEEIRLWKKIRLLI